MNRRRTLVLLFVAVLFGCRSGSSPRVTTPPGQQAEPWGTGCGDLIPIDAPNTEEGIRAENAWIREHYPGYRKTRQWLVACAGGGMADRIEIEGPDGDRKEVYFDISSFFGKW